MMRKVICLFIALNISVLVKAQYKINCGNQTFTITAKKISPIKQVDPQIRAVIITTYYYRVDSNKLRVWMETKDDVTRSFTAYEIEKAAIDATPSQQIVDYDQQDYTAPVKTLYIKCAAGKKGCVSYQLC